MDGNSIDKKVDFIVKDDKINENFSENKIEIIVCINGEVK